MKLIAHGIPKDYLKKDKWRQVRLFDLALLLHALHRAAEDEGVGHHDTHETVESIERKCNKEVFIEPRILEACLYAASMLNEQGKWWHPRGWTFEEWVKRVLGADTWNSVYNVIERKGE